MMWVWWHPALAGTLSQGEQDLLRLLDSATSAVAFELDPERSNLDPQTAEGPANPSGQSDELSEKPEAEPRFVDSLSRSIHFYGYPVKQTQSVQGKELQEIKNAVRTRLTNPPRNLVISFCWIPRHGFSLELPQGRLDLVVCLECCKYKAYVAGRLIAEVNDQIRLQAIFERLLPGTTKED
ncbi:MAG: hypothetical protein AAGK14_10295 [Verrucomicrobiota bacterium]